MPRFFQLVAPGLRPKRPLKNAWAGRDGEGQLLNLIVVEALAGVCESQSEMECKLEFRIPQIESIYDIKCDVAYDVKPRT